MLQWTSRWPHRIVFEYITEIVLESRRIEDAFLERESVRGQDHTPARCTCTGQMLLFPRWRNSIEQHFFLNFFRINRSLRFEPPSFGSTPWCPITDNLSHRKPPDSSTSPAHSNCEPHRQPHVGKYLLTRGTSLDCQRSCMWPRLCVCTQRRAIGTLRSSNSFVGGLRFNVSAASSSMGVLDASTNSIPRLYGQGSTLHSRYLNYHRKGPGLPLSGCISNGTSVDTPVYTPLGAESNLDNRLYPP